MGSMQYDDDKWPVLLITAPHVKLTREEFARELGRLHAYYERGEKFAIVMDVRNAPVMNAEERRVTAEQVDRHRERYGWVAPTAVVSSSAIHRGVMKTVMWLARNPNTMQAFGNIDDAVSWARSVLASSAGARASVAR